MAVMLHYNPEMLVKVRSRHIMAAADGKPCTLRIASLYPGHSCSGPETTVGAHLPVWGKGMSTKVTDLAVVFGCFNCHAMLDLDQDTKRAEYVRETYPHLFGERLIKALVETHAILIDDGLIVVPGAKLIE